MKTILSLRIVAAERVSPVHTLLRLTDDSPLPAMRPGQFVEVEAAASPTTFLRRPISVNFFDKAANELWLLVAMIGDGTKAIGNMKAGDRLSCVLPLGNGFTMPDDKAKRLLLVGGGVGVAPLLYFGAELRRGGLMPTFLLGAKSAKDLLELNFFGQYGRVFITTEDGTAGEQGFVTNHSVLAAEHFDAIATCGPKPMMKAVANYAAAAGTPCEASLENMMACGLGACLCCVEKTKQGHLCVCKDGPVFDTNELLW